MSPKRLKLLCDHWFKSNFQITGRTRDKVNLCTVRRNGIHQFQVYFDGLWPRHIKGNTKKRRLFWDAIVTEAGGFKTDRHFYRGLRSDIFWKGNNPNYLEKETTIFRKKKK